MKLKQTLIAILFVFILVSCNRELDFFADAPIAGESTCAWTAHEAFNLSLGKWNQDEIRFFIKNFPEHVEREWVRENIRRAYLAYEEHVDIPIFEVYDSSYADIVINFQKMDGIGGIHGQSYFPPGSSYDPYPVNITFDLYDICEDKREGLPLFSQVALHEAGHSLGLYHSYDTRSLMYANYVQDLNTLYIDDILGLRMKYGCQERFVYDNKTFVWIPNDNTEVSDNFQYQEFVSKCPEHDGEGHYIDQALLIAVQYLRYKYDCPIQIISSARDYECNLRAGGASRSMHLVNSALDFKFVGPMAKRVHKQYQRDIKKKEQILSSLLGYGIRGFGGYETSNHIDTRSAGMQEFMGKTYATWGTLNETTFNANEDFCIEIPT